MSAGSPASSGKAHPPDNVNRAHSKPAPTQRSPNRLSPTRLSPARLITVAGMVGVTVGGAASVPFSWRVGLPLGWVCAALLFTVVTWRTVWPLDAAGTRAAARREDPNRPLADLIILTGSVASLGGVALVLLAGSSAVVSKDAQAAISVAAVTLSWLCVHTVFTTRYAKLYYRDGHAGIAFNQPESPTYRDFAYLAFTVGMTFQVSDTAISDLLIRHTALRHALVSYLLGVVVIATTINLVAGLRK